MLPVYDISGWHKIQIRTEVQQGQQQQVRGGKKGLKNWNTTKQKQNYRASALCWEVVTPRGLALRKGTQSTREAPQSKAARGWMGVSAKSNIHKRFRKNLANKESIILKQT